VAKKVIYPARADFFMDDVIFAKCQDSTA